MCVGHLQFLFWVSLGLLLINRNCKVVFRSQLKKRRHILDNKRGGWGQLDSLNEINMHLRLIWDVFRKFRILPTFRVFLTFRNYLG